MASTQRGSFLQRVWAGSVWNRLENIEGECILILTLLVASFILSVPGVQAQTPKRALVPSTSPTPPQQAPAPAPTPAPPPDQAIPLPQVADRAEELDRVLREIAQQLTPTPELLEADRAAKAQAEEIAQRARQVDNLLAGMPDTMELREEQLYWRSLSQQYAAQRKLLTVRAADLQDRIRSLDSREAQWQATADQIHETVGIEAVVDRIRQELDAIQGTRSQAREQLNLLLTLQNQVSQQDRQISDVLARLDDAEKHLRGRLLERDSHPLWEAREVRQFDRPMSMMIHRSANREFTSVRDFLRANKLGVLGIPVLFVVGLLAAFKLKRYVRSGTRPGVPPEASEIFARPFSVALLVALLGMIGHTRSVPNTIAFVIYVACLILALRLLPPLIEPGLRPLLYTLAVFILLQGARALLPFAPVLKREVFALFILATTVILAWLARPLWLRQSQRPKGSRLLLVAGARIGLAVLAASLAANIFGFLVLSQVLAGAALLGAFIAAAFYGAARVLTLILITFLCSDRARSMPEARRVTVERWGPRLLVLSASLLWLRAELYLLTIHDSVVDAISSTLQYPIGFGTVHFTLWGVLSLILVLLLGYALANAVAFVLQKVLLARLPLQRGLPYAISKVTYYVLLVLVFVAALANAGVELNKFTLITGALGVGVGFGLQNVVNNFVSGLILLFERPIRVGDTVEVNGLTGAVKRIGARSSTVETAQGSEVIVPNSTLISNQVINWTLSAPHRCVQIPVGVAYGTDPEPVLKLLVEVADSNPRVMRYPKPTAFFLGFGDSALNFELRFWSTQETWFELKSDVTVGVAKALAEAGIEIPFPQRDLHVRSIDVSVKEALAANDSPSLPSADADGSSPARAEPQPQRGRNWKEE